MAGAEVKGDERLREQITLMQWERACIAAEVWKPGEIVRREDDDGHGAVLACPRLGDNTALVAMLDWLISNPESLKLLDYREIQAVMSDARNRPDWKSALVRAVLRMPPPIAPLRAHDRPTSDRSKR